MVIIKHSDFANFFEVKHPLIQHKLTLLRDVNTTNKLFTELVNEITMLLVYEASHELEMTTRKTETPLETFDAPYLLNEDVVIVPILRAGLGMVNGFLSLMPNARVGHIGLYRDKTTHEPKDYYFKIPEDRQNDAYFVCDPMLATGGSAIAAIQHLKDKSISNIIFVCLVAAPEGVQALTAAHPDIPIYCAGLDRELNNNKYIMPGLGDAGDRLFGTL